MCVCVCVCACVCVMCDVCVCVCVCDVCIHSSLQQHAFSADRETMPLSLYDSLTVHCIEDIG